MVTLFMFTLKNHLMNAAFYIIHIHINECMPLLSKRGNVISKLSYENEVKIT